MHCSPSRYVPQHGILNFLIDWRWDKDVCHGHDTRLGLVAQSGALQIFERGIGKLGTVIANENLHDSTRTILRPDRNLHYAVESLAKQIVSFPNFVERKTVG
jgi:hypothetical protein